MSEHPVPAHPAAVNPAQVTPAQVTPAQTAPSVPGPAPAPASLDPHAAAERAIDDAVTRLEQAREGSLDDQLEAAEHVHAVLGTHLSGSTSGPPGSR